MTMYDNGEGLFLSLEIPELQPVEDRSASVKDVVLNALVRLVGRSEKPEPQPPVMGGGFDII